MIGRRRLARALLLVGAALLLAWLCLPEPDWPEPPGRSRAVFDRHGALIHLSVAEDGRYRLRTALREISPDWIEATLLKEDRWFRWHPGVNPLALLRAGWAWARRHPAGGGSTLTMQVARLQWQLETRTWYGKLAQIARALQLERHCSKDEILEAYFNLAPYGGNVEGAGAAAWLWTGRGPIQVSRREAIALSVIPQSPSTRLPWVARDASRLAVAQSRLSTLMAGHSGLREDPLAAAFTLMPPGPPPHEAPHFCRRLMKSCASDQIASTLDLTYQHEIERGLREYLLRSREHGIVNGCAILVHAPTREVLSYVGSADYRDREIHGMVDGLRALRSPGSAIKPFIFGLALDQGLIHPRSLLVDGPMVFHNYNPENFEREFMGPIPADEALVRSRNLPAVELANRLGNGTLYQFLRRGGVSLPMGPGYYGLALALGGFGISPAQLAGLYAGLTDDGLTRPLVFSKPADAPPASAEWLSSASRFLVLEMLRGAGSLGAENGFGRGDPQVAWKTGTSHGFRDAWAVGVRGPYVLVVWLGNFNGRGNNALVARRSAAPLLFDLFRRLALPDALIVPPAGVGRVELCAQSGNLPGPHCAQRRPGSFIPGVSPISWCALHREILVDGISGKRLARDDGRPGLRREVHEFWPPDLLELFRKAGLPRRPVPEPENGSDTLAGIDPGSTLQILSPLVGRVYQASNIAAGAAVPLKVKAAPGVRQCYWFCGEAFLGSCAPHEVFAWHPRPGSYTLRVIDDHGRMAEAAVSVEN